MVGVHELHWSGWGKGHVQAVINMIMNLWVPHDVWNLLNSWTFRFSGMTLLHVVVWSVVPCFCEGLPACLIFWGAQPPTFPCPALFLLLLVDCTVITITTSAVNIICNIWGMSENLSQSLWTQNTAYSHVWQVLVCEQRCSAEMSMWACPCSLYEPIIILVLCLWTCILCCFLYVCMYVECSEFVSCEDYVEV